MRDFALRRPALAAALVAALLYLPWLAAAPVRGTLEANRLIAAREMLARHDWVLPTLNGEPYLAKPPFQYWLIEGAMWLFRCDVIVGGRLVSALAVILLAVFVAAFGKRCVSPAVGLVAGLGVPLAGIVLEKGVIAELETVLAAATGIAVLSFPLAAADPRRIAPRGFALGGIALGGLALGAAFLTKGPVVLVFLLPAAVAWIAASPGFRRRGVGCLIAQVLVGLACALPWILALLQRVGWDRAVSIYESEVFARVQHAGASNAAPWWFYGPGILGALGPLVLLLPFLAVLPWKDTARRPRLAFLLAWAVGPVLLLSLSHGKEVRYLIAGIPAWALLLAECVEAAWTEDRARGYRRFLRALAIGASWIAPFAAIAAGFLLTPAVRPAALAAGGLLLAARLLLSLRHGPSLRHGTAVAIVLALAGGKVLWAQVYLANARAKRPEIEDGRRIAARVPAGVELAVPQYDAVLHLAVDRPLRVVVDLARAELGPGALALVGADAATGPGWTELERTTFGAWSCRLLRRQASSSRHDP